MNMKKDLKIINPASGAIVMAIGIFLYAGIEAFPYLDHHLGKGLSGVLGLIGIGIYISLTRQFFHKDFLFPFLKNPVNSFVMGTWIAGVSVLGNVLLKYFPVLTPAVQVIVLINSVLYAFFLASCLYNFKELLKRPTFHSPHGVVLLSTVATQSIVIAWVKVFPFIPDSVLMAFMYLGIAFYLSGVFLIAFHYWKKGEWSLTDDWTNTNCIIHGALSITGLAMVSSQLMSAAFMMVFWVIVFMLLVGVEVLEAIRAFKRLRAYGWKKGVLTYDISQWSRNFTFGMFYAFSVTMHNNPHYMNAMYDFHEYFLAMWAWVVLVVLLVEGAIWLESKWHVVDKFTKEKAI